MKLEAESPTVGLRSFPKASELTTVLLSEGESMATTWKMFISRSSNSQFCMMIWGHFNRESSFTGGLRVSYCTLLSVKYQKQSSIPQQQTCCWGFLWNLNSRYLKPQGKNILSLITLKKRKVFLMIITKNLNFLTLFGSFVFFSPSNQPGVHFCFLFFWGCVFHDNWMITGWRIFLLAA